MVRLLRAPSQVETYQLFVFMKSVLKASVQDPECSEGTERKFLSTSWKVF